MAEPSSPRLSDPSTPTALQPLPSSGTEPDSSHQEPPSVGLEPETLALCSLSDGAVSEPHHFICEITRHVVVVRRKCNDFFPPSFTEVLLMNTSHTYSSPLMHRAGARTRGDA